MPTKSVQIQAERSLSWIFTILAKPRRGSDVTATTRIPDSLIYQHGSLRQWLMNDDRTGHGDIVARDKRDCTTDRIVAILGAAPPIGAVSDGVRVSRDVVKPTEAPLDLPVAAYYVYQPVKKSSVACSGALLRDASGDALDRLEVHFMNRMGLRLFLEQSRAPRHSALLQRFPYGRTPVHATAEVAWTPHQTFVTLRQSLRKLDDASVPLFDRCCTSESAAHLSREVKATPLIVKRLSQECRSIVDHIAAVEGRQTLRMVLTFAFDHLRRPTLLYSNEVHMTAFPMPLMDVKAGLAQTYTRPLMQIAPAVVDGLKAILAAGGGMREADATGTLQARVARSATTTSNEAVLLEPQRRTPSRKRLEALLRPRLKASLPTAPSGSRRYVTLVANAKESQRPSSASSCGPRYCGGGGGGFFTPPRCGPGGDARSSTPGQTEEAHDAPLLGRDLSLTIPVMRRSPRESVVTAAEQAWHVLRSALALHRIEHHSVLRNIEIAQGEFDAALTVLDDVIVNFSAAVDIAHPQEGAADAVVGMDSIRLEGCNNTAIRVVLQAIVCCNDGPTSPEAREMFGLVLSKQDPTVTEAFSHLLGRDTTTGNGSLITVQSSSSLDSREISGSGGGTDRAAARRRLCQLRADACTLRSASFYAAVGEVMRLHKAAPSAVQGYLHALAARASNGLEWPPRWAIAL